MGKMSRVLRCNNCGEILQSDNINLPGYIPTLILKDTNRILYCENCYQKRKVNRGELSSSIDDNSFKILSDAKNNNSLIVLIIDIFAFNGVIKKTIIDLIKDVSLIIVANKKDLLPLKSSDEQIIKFIKSRFKEYEIDPLDVLIISTNKGYNFETIKEKIKTHAKNKNVYIIGGKGSGKTAIINRLLKTYKNTTNRPIQTIKYKDIDAKVLTMPIDDNTNAYELDGFSLDDSIYGALERNIINKYVLLKKCVKARKFHLKENDTLLLGGIAMIGLKQGKNSEIKAYFNEKIEIKKMPLSKEKIFFKTNLINKNLLPVSDLLQDFSNFDLFQYEMENDNLDHEIAIKGLGFIIFKGLGQTIYIMVPKGVAIKEGIPRLC